MNLPGDVAAVVRQRAASRCQYCLMHQSLQGATFHIEHIIPRARGGTDELTNLTLACPSCNLHKSDSISAIDPTIGASVSLFHPNRDRWLEHFRFDGNRIEGLTAVGRVTITALDCDFFLSEILSPKCASAGHCNHSVFMNSDGMGLERSSQAN
jgi:hypothetical protein